MISYLQHFLPFSSNLLHRSGQRITPIYLVYQASEAEEHIAAENISSNAAAAKSRKRGDSEMLDDHEVDDFILSDKRQRLTSFSKNPERENQFTYGLSPGFHI